MSKKLIVLVFCFLNVISIHSQNFAPIGAEWNFTETFALSSFTDVISFNSVADSVVDNRSYRVIEKSKSSCSLRFSGKQLIHQSNDSIFHLNEISNELNLIIDFGADQGDFWYINKYSPTEIPDSMICIVDNVRAETIGNDFLQVQYVTLMPIEDGAIVNDLSFSTRIIENIGFELALFPPAFSYLCDGNYEGNIICYQDENYGLIEFSDQECLSPTENISDSDIKVYPNPSNAIVYIESSHKQNIHSIELFDFSGRRLMREIENQHLDVQNINNGVYFLKIAYGDRIKTKRIIVSK